MTDFDFGPIISAYTRSQAIADGALVDVSKTAREAGIIHPTAMTAAAFDLLVAWTEGDNDRKGTVQDEPGRLWDVLWMLRVELGRGGSQRSAVDFVVYAVPRAGTKHRALPHHLKALVHPGDRGEPVITIMLPEED